jgi:hypothetical protein
MAVNSSQLPSNFLLTDAVPLSAWFWFVTLTDADLSFLRPVQQLIFNSPNMALDPIDGALACGAVVTTI